MNAIFACTTNWIKSHKASTSIDLTACLFLVSFCYFFFQFYNQTVELQDVFESDAFIFLVFELCRNGELFDYLTSVVTLSEKKTRYIMRYVNECSTYNWYMPATVRTRECNKFKISLHFCWSLISVFLFCLFLQTSIWGCWLHSFVFNSTQGLETREYFIRR